MIWLLVEKVEQPEENTILLSEVEEDGAVPDLNVLTAIEISTQETVPPDHKDIIEGLNPEHSTNFEMEKRETLLANTEADLVGMEKDKSPRGTEDFQEQATECNGNSYEEITKLRLQSQQNCSALSGSEKLIAELRESLSDAEERAEKLALELAEGPFLSRNLGCSLGVM